MTRHDGIDHFGCASWFLLVVACMVFWWIIGTALPAHCDNRYGYPEYRPQPINRSFVLTVLGSSEIYVINPEPVVVVPAFVPMYVPDYVQPARRWEAAPCRMQGAFAVDWRESCRRPTK